MGEAWWTILNIIYERGMEGVKHDGLYSIAEIDEALLARKQTYNHGQIAATFKIKVFGMILRKEQG